MARVYILQDAKRGPFPGGRTLPAENVWYVIRRTPRCSPMRAACGASAATFAPPRITPAVFRHLIRCHSIRRQEDGRALTPAQSRFLVVIVPAFNEQGAIAGVVRSD